MVAQKGIKKEFTMPPRKNDAKMRKQIAALTKDMKKLKKKLDTDSESSSSDSDSDSDSDSESDSDWFFYKLKGP